MIETIFSKLGKNTLYILGIFLFASFFVTSTSVAKATSHDLGYFECVYEFGDCHVNLNSSFTCDPTNLQQYEDYCDQFQNANDCDLSFGNCQLNQPPTTCWSCQLGICSEVPLPPGYTNCTAPYYSDEASCTAGCTNYSCNQTTGDCSPDPTGPYSNYSQCAGQCPATTAPPSIPPSAGTEPRCNYPGGIPGVLDGINTAIGCIPFIDSNEFAAFILRWGIGIGGGIAFLLIVYSGFMVITSSGSPERLKAGQELLTAAITGLLLLLFSAFILEFIGINIIGIPNFGT